MLEVEEACESERPTNRSATIQLWLIGMIVPLSLMAVGKFGQFDFASLWVASRQVLNGEAVNVYSAAATQVYADQLGLGYNTNFPYPPHALLVFTPFSLASYIPGYFIWNLFCAAAFVWAARPYLPRRFPLILAISTPAALFCFDFGQTGLIVGALWLLAFRGKWAAVAIMTMKPHVGLLSILSLKSRDAFIKTCILAALAIAASALLFGTTIWLEFFTHSFVHSQYVAEGGRWLHSGVGPAMAYGYWGWVPFAVAGGLMLARNVNVFTASTASFLITPYAFHYDMPVASLGFGLLVFTHWRAMPISHRIPIALGFLSPAIAVAGAWWVPPILLWALWTQVKYEVWDKAGAIAATDRPARPPFGPVGR